MRPLPPRVPRRPQPPLSKNPLSPPPPTVPKRPAASPRNWPCGGPVALRCVDVTKWLGKWFHSVPRVIEWCWCGRWLPESVVAVVWVHAYGRVNPPGVLEMLSPNDFASAARWTPVYRKWWWRDMVPISYFGDKAIKTGRKIKYRLERGHDDEMQFIITGVTRLSKYMNCS